MRDALGTALLAHPGAELYGSDRVMLETLAGLVAAGTRVVLTTPVDGPLLAAARELGATTQVLPVPVLRKALLKPAALARLVPQSVRALVRIRALVREVRPDVVYVSTLTVPLWQVALARLPALVHVHESERDASPLLRRALALPLLAADRVLVNSRHSQGALLEVLPRLARRSAVVYNGVPGPASVEPARGELAGALRIVYVGRLSPRKGVDVALDAVALLNDRGIEATLDLVGDVFPGYEWYAAQLREQADRLGIAEKVTFRGFQPSVWPALADADVAVVPSRLEEPFGNTAVEALLAARPVVVSAIGGLVEAVDGVDAALTVEPGSPERLADALQRIAADWDRFREAARAAAEAAARRFSPARYRDEVRGELTALAARRTRAGTRRPRTMQNEGEVIA